MSCREEAGAPRSPRVDQELRESAKEGTSQAREQRVPRLEGTEGSKSPGWRGQTEQHVSSLKRTDRAAWWEAGGELGDVGPMWGWALFPTCCGKPLVSVASWGVIQVMVFDTVFLLAAVLREA